jgi:uncharacterized protein (DUF433 family)
MLNLPRLDVPLVSNPNGHVCVEGSDVRLEEIVAAYEGGASAEEIAARHEMLRLSDVYLVLSFYLKRRKEAEDYLAGQSDGGRIQPRSAA